jgi:hypothetical protein
MRQRLLLVKCRSSGRKLKTGAPPGRAGGMAKDHRGQFDYVARRPDPRPRVVDPDVVSPREVELTLMARDRQVEGLHHRYNASDLAMLNR